MKKSRRSKKVTAKEVAEKIVEKAVELNSHPIVQEKKNMFKKLFDWTMNHFFKTFIILALINILFMMSGKLVPMIISWAAFLLLIIYIITFLVKSIQKNVHKLIHHELRFSQVLTVYLTSAIFIVLLFSMMYWAMTAVGAGYLKYGECVDNTDITREMIKTDPLRVTSAMQYPYFSAITFFSVGFGDMCPMGMSKAIAMINALIGNAFTVIILAIAITNYSANRSEDIHKGEK